MATAPRQLKITDRHRHVLSQVLAAHGEQRFRRSDLAVHVYPLTSPRNRELADAISNRVLREAEAAGQIRREGHQHWIKVDSGRQLFDGSVAPDVTETHRLVLNTKCPSKWLAVDLETGDVWRGTTSGWARHPGQHREAIVALVGTRRRRNGKGGRRVMSEPTKLP